MKKLVILFCLVGCASVTPADRAVMYASFAKEHQFKCSAYRFDLSSNLVEEVPAMARVCP